MNSKCLNLLVIFCFLLPISPRCDYSYAPMNGECTPCVPGCYECYGNANYCTICNKKDLIRGACRCNDVGCEMCKFSNSSICEECGDGFYPKPSKEGTCIQCPVDCPYCGHKSKDGWNVDVCHKCEPPHQAYNRSTCTPCPKNCHSCGTTAPYKEFKCLSCEVGYTLNPTWESCAACLGDNCLSCQFESLDKCYRCSDGTYLNNNEKCVPDIPNCEAGNGDKCSRCNPYFYRTTEYTCKRIPEEGCKYWDNINQICTDGCLKGYWDEKLGVCEECKRGYFPLTTYANISSYKRCVLTCNTVSYLVDAGINPVPVYCLTENICPPGYYLNKYRNCISCGGNRCTNCTDKGCVEIDMIYYYYIELFAADWKGQGYSFGTAVLGCRDGKYLYNETYCFKDHCPCGMKVNGTTCYVEHQKDQADYGVTFSFLLIFIILFI